MWLSFLMRWMISRTHATVVRPASREQWKRFDTNMKICYLDSILAPYSIPRFTALQALKRDDVIQVMALGATEAIREWQVRKSGLGFDYMEAFQGETVDQIDSRALVERVTCWLDDSNPQAVVIAGYDYPAMRAAARWARRNGRVSIFVGDSQWVDRQRIVPREWVKAWVGSTTLRCGLCPWRADSCVSYEDGLPARPHLDRVLRGR